MERSSHVSEVSEDHHHSSCAPYYVGKIAYISYRPWSLSVTHARASLPPLIIRRLSSTADPRRSRGGHENSRPFSHSPPFFPGSLSPVFNFQGNFLCGSCIKSQHPIHQINRKNVLYNRRQSRNLKQNGMNEKPNGLPFGLVLV